MSAQQTYPTIAKWIHWVTAFLVIYNIVFGFQLDELTGQDLSEAFESHVTVGVLILALTILRFSWIKAHPPIPAEIPAYERRMAKYAHRAFYVLLVFVPLSGLSAAIVQEVPVLLFWSYDLRSLVAITGDQAAALRETLHVLPGQVLAGLIIIHVAAATYHRFRGPASMRGRMSKR